MCSMRRFGRVVLFVAAAALICGVFFLGGCGGSETAENATSVPPMPTQAPQHQAASGPAVDVNTELTLDQLALLESPVTKTKDRNGLEFLKFKYVDRDGRVYPCELPASLGAGKHKWTEWLSTFNIYRKASAASQKTAGKENLADFPYISPKPQEQPATTDQPRPTINVPTAPTAPSGPSGMPSGPGPMGPPPPLPSGAPRSGPGG